MGKQRREGHTASEEILEEFNSVYILGCPNICLVEHIKLAPTIEKTGIDRNNPKQDILRSFTQMAQKHKKVLEQVYELYDKRKWLFQAEAYMILRASTWLIDDWLDDRRLALSSFLITSKIVPECRTRLNSISRFNIVELL